MRENAENWVENRVQNDVASVLQVWANNEEWQNYFTLATTNEIEEFEKDREGDYYIVCRQGDPEMLLDFIPEGETLRSELATIELPALGEKCFSSSLQTDVRLERYFTDDGETWGASFPGIRFEHWVEENAIPNIEPSVREEIHQIVGGKVGVNLGRHPDYWGNIVITLEDQRAKIRRNSGHYVEIDTEIIDTSNSSLVFHWKEFGDTIWTESLSLESFFANGNTDGGNTSSEAERSTFTIITGQEQYECEYPTVPQPGASGVTLSVVSDGETLDKQTLPLMRIIKSNIQIGETDDTQSGPPSFYHESPTDQSGITVTVGNHIWDDRRIAFGASSGMKGWCTDANEEVVAEAFSAIKNEIQSAVKIVDPYLGADDISDFVGQLDRDISVWVITSNLSNANTLTSKLQQYDQSGRKVEILRIMDSEGGPGSTPLHDRFILSNGPRGWMLGTSFDTLGENVSVISELPFRIVNKLDHQFNSWWHNPVQEKDGSQTCRKSRLGVSQL